MQKDDTFKTLELQYAGGERYPNLVREPAARTCSRRSPVRARPCKRPRSNRPRQALVLPIVLTEAVREADFAAARVLFREYAAGLGVDLCFQGFEAELGRCPRCTALPRGAWLLARADDRIVGCGALRRLGAGECAR